ncbi:hypothetical protein [Ralstonia chuxiongensis]|uniref:Uncharacterized protein n=1 Tax=Ralstonia chuxiongensis TaxID=2957504 RepID=A0AA42BLC6_9RALS|nr:hypothetical protein [Ralstonia chuxiongensis]MCP1173762.1 hypothetical protein [Ralstonia chuxiongensis]
MCLSNEAAAIKLAERDNLVGELVEALQMIYLEQIDYITLNNLGDPHHNQSMQMARAALAKAREGAQS